MGKSIGEFFGSEPFRYVFPITVVVGIIIAAGIRLGCFHLDVLSKKPEAPNRKKQYQTVDLRGSIYSGDIHSAPLASSVLIWKYNIDPKDPKVERSKLRKIKGTNITLYEKTISIIANALKCPEEEIRRKYEVKNSRYVPLLESDNNDIYKNLTTNKIPGLNPLPGLAIKEIDVRRYHYGKTASHVVGYVNFNKVGSLGIEQRHNRHLTAIPGEVKTFKTAREKEVYRKRITEIPAKRGNDIYTTIIPHIQHHTEMALYDGLTNANAEAGWAVVMDVKSGAVLAMAGYPDFEPEFYNNYSTNYYKNPAISVVFEPGSVMKVFTAAAALSEGTANAHKKYYTEKSHWYYRGKILRESHPMPDYMTLTEALVHSSNIVYAKVGLELGPSRLWNYFRDFGFGQKTGIDLPAEEKGIFAKYTKWDGLKPSRVPIGQGISVTALQLISAFAAIGNDGVLMRPYIISKIVSNEGEVIFQHEPTVAGTPIKPMIAKQLRYMLLGVAKRGGTAKRAAVQGYTVAGKTGTAQMAVKGGYSSTEFTGSFMGIIPATQPRLAILVSYQKGDRSKRMHLGGACAAPVFKRIAEMAMRYLEVPPDMPDEIPEYGGDE